MTFKRSLSIQPLVISNLISPSFITRMITDRIGLHSVLLPLLILTLDARVNFSVENTFIESLYLQAGLYTCKLHVVKLTTSVISLLTLEF